MEDDSTALDTSRAGLQEIILPGAILYALEFRALHSICGSVTKLSISLFGNRVGGRGQVAADTLYVRVLTRMVARLSSTFQNRRTGVRVRATEMQTGQRLSEATS